MAPRMKVYLLVLLLLFIPLLSSGLAEGFSKDGMNLIYSPALKDGIEMKTRKLLGHDLQDYDDAGPNPKHDPCKKGKPPCPRSP